ncbi:hypothetical protein EYF80_009859 [Liparis tanakae]|uniref:Uncharacterized protein n=1 Tax=Liparis tanakae TaxID=230148 RepID=A0A4Z2IRF8_9TELE|nr:hypothetical protein EYF80_009859 [Liparis tanakae]
MLLHTGLTKEGGGEGIRVGLQSSRKKVEQPPPGRRSVHAVTLRVALQASVWDASATACRFPLAERGRLDRGNFLCSQERTATAPPVIR